MCACNWLLVPVAKLWAYWLYFRLLVGGTVLTHIGFFAHGFTDFIILSVCERFSRALFIPALHSFCALPISSVTECSVYDCNSTLSCMFPSKCNGSSLS